MKFTGILSGRTLLIAGVGLTLTAHAAFAQDRAAPRQPQSRMIQMMDTNEDQKVSIDEIKAEHKRMILGSDLNGDGKLDAKEFARRGWMYRRPPTTTLFDLLDANGDGQLTAEELSAPSERWFKRYDVNGDGFIDESELPQFFRGHGSRRGGPTGGGPGGPPMRSAPGSQGGGAGTQNDGAR